MKPSAQCATSAIALAGLLWAAGSQATSMAELPLKTSVLAKPNVIFGMDDSGSMDSEVMFYNNDGAYWWDYNAGTGWGVDAAHPNPSLRTKTSTWFNPGGTASTQWRKMVYLFPNGSGTGNRVYSDASNDHFAILPTTQFAFARWSGVYLDSATGKYRSPPIDPAVSSVHNPIYYNPLITYWPWAPAQISSGAVTPGAATATAAKSHPIYGTGTMNLTVNVSASSSPAADTVFTAFPGMRIPSGAFRSECNSTNGACGAWTAVVGDSNAGAGKVTRVSASYYPATYWVKEDCVPENTSLVTDTCTTAPDGSRLKRYEIKPGNTFPSGRTYAAELQNFANWWQYYRKRKLMLAGAMGDTMENLTGMRLGVIAFNNLTGNVTLYDADATAASANRLRVAGIFYEANGSGGTPTRETLKYIGEQFKRTDQTSGKYNVIQYACQRNNAFIVTDGFANNSSVSPPSYDSGKSAATWGSGAPYGWNFTRDGILADLALRYYTNNPRTDLATGAVLSTPSDSNNNLHMNTYGLTLGARGTVWLGEDTPPPVSTAAWPDPNADRNPTSVDDLWHATINGRGKMYLATTPEETALRIQAGLNDILSQDGAQGGVAVSAVNLDRSDGKAYLGYYNRLGWVGDLEARAINTATAVISASVTWSASAQLLAKDWTKRLIFSASGGTGADFTAANVGAQVNPDTSTFTNAQIVDYLRGSRVGEGDTVRLRSSLLGPVVNSEPVLARAESTVYVASGEGMLHAFDTTNGNERWAFAPPDALSGMGKSAVRGWVYNTLLDATPSYGQLQDLSKLLVGGMGAAGRSYYALDVSAPAVATSAAAAAQFKWVFPTAGDTTNRANMGYTAGRPVFARVLVSGTLTDVVLVTSGYDNGLTIGDGKGRLWMLRASDGSVIKSFRTSAGTAGTAEAGLSAVAAFRETDGSVQYAYGGDLLGNLWRFDLTAAGATDIAPTQVAVLKDGSGNLQPVTSAPELVMISGKRVILVGTGRLLDITDFGSARTQTFYAITDGATLSNARSSLVAKTYTRGANPEITGSAVDWGTGRGWYVDLPAGEQVNTDPIVAYGAVAFVGNKNGGTDCSQQAYMYLVDITSGGATALAVNGSVSQLLSGTATSSRVVVLRDSTGRLNGTVQLSDRTVKNIVLPLGQSIPPTKNSWREIRR